MDRRDLILDGLDRGGLGLEIGAGYGPLAAGQPGFDVRTLDHLDQAGLVAKYARMSQPTDHIRPVDYVWTGQPYGELVGDTRFDFIVASHVVEHVPDLVGFINGCAEILNEDGVLTLAVPDRRYTFDYYRPVAGLREMIDAMGRTTSSPGNAAEHFLYLSRLAGQDTWGEGATGRPEFVLPIDKAQERYGKAMAGQYVDVHAWVFTPHSMRLALADLNALGLLALKERRFHPTQGFEFFIQLSRRGAGPGMERAALAEMAVSEQAPL